MKDVILKVLNDYFQNTTGDVKDYDIENCARDIVEALEAAQQSVQADTCRECGNRTFKPAIIERLIEVCVVCGTRR